MITNRQRRMLGIIGELQPVVIQDLMSRDGTTRRALTTILKRLKDAGFVAVVKEMQAEGNWIWRYSLTEKGAEDLGIRGEGEVRSSFFGFDPFWAEIDRAMARASRERGERE